MEQPRLDFITLADGAKLFFRIRRAAPGQAARRIDQHPQTPDETFNLHPTIVAIHGYAGNHTSWLPILESLEERGFETLVFDMRGHGLSSKPHAWRQYSFEQFTDDFIELLRRLGVSRAVVLGYSAGGAIALQAALKAPERIKKLILISANHRNPFYYWRIGVLTPLAKAGLRVLSWLVGWYKRRTYNFADLRTIDGYWPSVYKGLTSMPLAVNIRCLATFGELNLSNNLSAIAQPTLLIRSAHDPLVTKREIKEMAHRMPHARMLTVNVGGHWLLTRHAGQLYGVIRDFLSERETLPAPPQTLIPEASPEEIEFKSHGIEDKDGIKGTISENIKRKTAT
ncbi:alpha/beta hydrolase [Candidatus Parcubacteria bacterium]|nr:alpha/beta hydrolase [Candidatus Parcubacteria bacterium]